MFVLIGQVYEFSCRYLFIRQIFWEEFLLIPVDLTNMLGEIDTRGYCSYSRYIYVQSSIDTYLFDNMFKM